MKPRISDRYKYFFKLNDEKFITTIKNIGDFWCNGGVDMINGNSVWSLGQEKQWSIRSDGSPSTNWSKLIGQEKE